MIAVFGVVQALVRIDMTMPAKPEPGKGNDISPWEREAYGEGGRFGSMTSIPSGDPSKDKIGVTLSGCAYDVARYLAKEGHEVAFIGLTGEDALGKAALADLEDAGVDTSRMAKSKKMTSIRIEARNFLGDMEFMRVDESIQEDLTAPKAMEMMGDPKGIDLAFADGSLPVETLKAIGKKCREEDIELFFDPASLEGAERGAECLEFFTGIMPGRREAEFMSGLQILSAEQMSEAGKHFENSGIEKVIITIKGGGVFYMEGESQGVIKPQRVLQFAETSGAGDVMTAELMNCFARKRPVEEAAKAGMDAVDGYLANVEDERKY